MTKDIQMNSKHNQIRVLGQRSISSSFVFGSPNLAKVSEKDAQEKGLHKDSSFSFSDFLDQKLHTNPVPPKTVKGKSKPFRSPLGFRDDNGSIDHWIEIKMEKEEGNSVIEQVFFEQFKHIPAKNENGIESGDGSHSADVEKGTSTTSLEIDSSYVGDIGSSISSNEQEIRKRRNPFEGGHEKDTTREHSLVLGADPKPNQRGRENRFFSNKKPRPLYNHYGNGRGWWDSDMEGIDTEEVGFGEIWEGVGSTTFGGIEWH